MGGATTVSIDCASRAHFPYGSGESIEIAYPDDSRVNLEGSLSS